MKEREIKIDEQGEDLPDYFLMSEEEINTAAKKYAKVVNSMIKGETHLGEATKEIMESFTLQELAIFVAKGINADASEAARKCMCFKHSKENKEKNNTNNSNSKKNNLFNDLLDKLIK